MLELRVKVKSLGSPTTALTIRLKVFPLMETKGH